MNNELNEMNRQKFPGKPQRTIADKSANEKEEPTLVSALVANFFTPGLGSWRMGCKKRGALIFLLMLLCVIMAGIGYASSISKQMDAALNMQDDVGFETSMSSSGSFFWVTLGMIVFIWSFVDIFLIYAMRKKKQ
ncbi:MAG: hypothetical protein KKB51_05960 [Candidatus Riflebacteria bacterium]|nr:hypothetical protein [Candidatus Riflebacteria bacterium]